MAKITDKMLLKKAMEFCDEIALEDDIKGYILNAKQNHLQYPLDKQVKDELKIYVIMVLIELRKNYLMK